MSEHQPSAQETREQIVELPDLKLDFERYFFSAKEEAWRQLRDAWIEFTGAMQPFIDSSKNYFDSLNVEKKVMKANMEKSNELYFLLQSMNKSWNECSEKINLKSENIFVQAWLVKIRETAALEAGELMGKASIFIEKISADHTKADLKKCLPKFIEKQSLFLEKKPTEPKPISLKELTDNALRIVKKNPRLAKTEPEIVFINESPDTQDPLIVSTKSIITPHAIMGLFERIAQVAPKQTVVTIKIENPQNEKCESMVDLQVFCKLRDSNSQIVKNSFQSDIDEILKQVRAYLEGFLDGKMTVTQELLGLKIKLDFPLEKGATENQAAVKTKTTGSMISKNSKDERPKTQMEKMIGDFLKKSGQSYDANSFKTICIELNKEYGTSGDWQTVESFINKCQSLNPQVQ